MNKARAMLDALMGPGRDQTKDPNAQDWKDRSICRGYLVGFCPLDKSAMGGKRTMDVCPKIHSDIIRTKFEASSDGAEDSDFRIRCEEISLRDLEYVISECEGHTRRELERIKREPKPRRLPTEVNQKISAMKREIEQLRLKSETLDDCDSKLKEQLEKQAATLSDDCDAYQKEEEKKAADAIPTATTCEVCGTAYLGQAEYDQHLKYKLHDGYAMARERFSVLRKKRAERESAERLKKDEERNRKNQELIKKDEEENGKKKGKGDKSDDEKDEKKKDKDKDRAKGSRSRDREREKDKVKGKDRERSRDREKQKGRSNSRTKDKERERSRDKDKARKKGRSRSRSRSKGRGRDKDRERKRSRSRSRRKSRSRRRR